MHVRPNRIRQFGDPRGVAFCLVTNPELSGEVTIGEADGYEQVLVIPFAGGDDFVRLLERDIPARAHVLVVSPNAFFQSPPQDRLGEGRKLLAMACNSTPTRLDQIEHFLRIIEDTDPVMQQDFADRFFEIGQTTAFLEFVDARYGTRARFQHLSERYLWNEQAGLLGWGEQQIAPSGEISALPLHIWDFDADLFLELDGTITLQGYPILHNGTPSFQREDQARIHGRLAAMQQGALIAAVESGKITAVEATCPEARPALEMLLAMFEVDSRYRILWELGFAINTTSRIVPGNLAMNEVYGARNGSIHFGLGLTPYTQYHLDLICPGTSVLTDQGMVLLGDDPAGVAQASKGRMARVRAQQCPCIE